MQIAAADIGTGARTVLTQMRPRQLSGRSISIHVEIGYSDLPFAHLAGGSSGTASWGSAVVLGVVCENACRPVSVSLEVSANTTEEIASTSRPLPPRVRCAVRRGPG